MKKKFLCIEAKREVYSPNDAHTLTLRDLIEHLECIADECGDDTPVVISNDRGYTYGGIKYEDVYTDEAYDD